MNNVNLYQHSTYLHRESINICQYNKDLHRESANICQYDKDLYRESTNLCQYDKDLHKESTNLCQSDKYLYRESINLCQSDKYMYTKKLNIYKPQVQQHATLTNTIIILFNFKTFTTMQAKQFSPEANATGGCSTTNWRKHEAQVSVQAILCLHCYLSTSRRLH